MTLEEFFSCLPPKTMQEIVAACKAKLTQLAAHAGLKLEPYVDAKGLLHSWVQVRGSNTTEKHRARNLAKIYRWLELPLPVDYRARPWNRFAPGDTVVICVGQRYVSLPEVAEDVRQRAIGARDVEAFTELLQFLQNDLSLDCRLQVENIPVGLSQDQARRKLESLRATRHCGAVIVVGSPIVNRLADPLAQAILKDCPETLPGKFRWSFPLNQPSPFLSEPAACDADEEGIRAVGDDKTTYPRMRDDDVFRARTAPRRAKKVFADCGMLLFHAPERGPFLILAAGHGGCGTIAAVLALREQEEVSRRFEESDAEDAVFGPNRVCELIEVRRSKPSSVPLDDLEISREMNTGARFHSGWRFA